MTAEAYRYEFASEVPPEEVEVTFVLSVFTIEALHGEAQTRLDAGHAFDGKRRVMVIAADTPVGRDLNRVFLKLITREFGPGSFRVERAKAKEQEPVAA